MTAEHGRNPWRPTPAFYLRNPEARELYPLCVQTVKIIDRLLQDPEAQPIGVRRDLYGQLHKLGSQFVEKGITPNMNSDEPVERYQSDPLFTIQWVAGGLLLVTDRRIPPIHEVEEQSVTSMFLIASPDDQNGMGVLKDRAIVMHVRNLMFNALGFIDLPNSHIVEE